MEIFRLDVDHYPSTSFPEFDSLIWSERYQGPGDFKLVVMDDISVLETFPEGSLISHTDTLSVMMVENHEIVRDSSKKLKVTVSGRTFETFAENRAVIGSDQPLFDGAGEKIVETTISWPAELVAGYLFNKSLTEGDAPVDEHIVGIQAVVDVREVDDAMEHVIKRGDTYSRMMEFCKLGGVGIKIQRPHEGFTTMIFYIHDGADRRETVIFYAQQEDLEDATYFWSIKGHKNYAQIAAHDYARLYRSRDEPIALTGINRRVMYVEAEDIEGDYDPPDPTDVISGRGQVELDQHRKISLLQAKIANSAKPKFKIDYDVGDLVTVFGEFSTQQTMRVTEHILTVDKAGMRGFPSLSIV